LSGISINPFVTPPNNDYLASSILRIPSCGKLTSCRFRAKNFIPFFSPPSCKPLSGTLGICPAHNKSEHEKIDRRIGYSNTTPHHNNHIPARWKKRKEGRKVLTDERYQLE
jgi:hypothetical protein